MSSIGLLQAQIISKLRTTGNYRHSCDFCNGGGNLVVCGGGLVVGGGSFCGDWGCVSTGDGFQRSFADLTPYCDCLR